MKVWKTSMIIGALLMAIAAIGNFTPQYNTLLCACGFVGIVLFMGGAIESVRNDAK